MPARIDIPHEKIASFCRRNDIMRLALFGSVLREDFTPESDVDVLVEFAPDKSIGLLGIARMEQELSSLLSRRADIHTFRGIEASRNYIRRNDILTSYEVQYEQTES